MYVFRALRSIYTNIKYQRILNEVYEQDQIILKLSSILGVQFRKDWIGRLYAVVNPAIKDGAFDASQVYEYVEGGYDTTEHAQQWMMQRISIIQNFIQANNLFDLLTFRIKRLDNNGNYLLMIFPITLPAMKDSIKKAGYEILGLAAVSAGFLLLWPKF